jgi:uncharacterized protein
VLFDLGWPGLGVLALAALLGGFVKGYAGFGLPAVVLTLGGLVTDPRGLVAPLLLVDLLVSAGQIASIRGHVEWRRVGLLSLGCLLGVPLGVWAVAQAGEDAARLAIGAFVLLMCAVLAAGWRLARVPGGPAWASLGVVSGVANGAAVGGMPVAAFMAAQPIPAAAFRATNVAYFAFLDLWTLPVMWRAGLFTTQSLWTAALLLPVTALGLTLGNRRFARGDPGSFRRFAIGLLAALSVLAILRALL